MRICSVEGCERKHSAKGLCGRCYRAKYRADNPEKSRTMITKSKAANPEKYRAILARAGAKYRAANPEKLLAAAAEYRADRPWSALAIDAKTSARKYNRSFALTHEGIRSIWPVDKRCPDCRKAFTPKGKGSRWDSPSLDRIDSSRGYEPDNISIICWNCNAAKNDDTLEDVIRKHDTISPGAFHAHLQTKEIYARRIRRMKIALDACSPPATPKEAI